MWNYRHSKIFNIFKFWFCFSILTLILLWSNNENKIILYTDAQQNLDTIIGIQGKDFVVLACDSLFYRSGIVMKNNDDKIIQIDKTKLLAIGGPTFMVDILVNWFKSMIRLIQIQQFRIPTCKSVAHFCRSTFRQTGGLPCSIMLAAYDEKPQKVSLYWLDYLGSLHRTRYAVHGPSAPFLYALLDEQYNEYRKSRHRQQNDDIEKTKNQDDTDTENHDYDVTIEQAIQIIQNCFEELEKRFQLNTNPNRSQLSVLKDDDDNNNRNKRKTAEVIFPYSLKIVDSKGCRTLAPPLHYKI